MQRPREIIFGKWAPSTMEWMEKERERAMSDGGAARRARVEGGSEAAEGNGEKSRKFL